MREHDPFGFARSPGSVDDSRKLAGADLAGAPPVFGNCGVIGPRNERLVSEEFFAQIGIRRRADDVFDGAQAVAAFEQPELFVKELRQNRYVLINRAGEKMLGLSRAEVVGKSDHDLFPAEEADAYFATRSRMAQIGAWASKQSSALESRLAFEKAVARFAARRARRPDRGTRRDGPCWTNGSDAGFRSA